MRRWEPAGEPLQGRQPWTYVDGDATLALLLPLSETRWIVQLPARDADHSGAVRYDGPEAQAKGFAEHLLAWYAPEDPAAEVARLDAEIAALGEDPEALEPTLHAERVAWERVAHATREIAQQRRVIRLRRLQQAWERGPQTTPYPDWDTLEKAEREEGT